MLAEIDSSGSIHLPALGLLGYEALQDYLLVPDAATQVHVIWSKVLIGHYSSLFFDHIGLLPDYHLL